MNTHADKTQENKSRSAVNEVSQKQSGADTTFQFVNNRPEAVAQRKLQEAINNSPRVQQLKAYQEMANSPQVKPLRDNQPVPNIFTSQTAQRKENSEEETLQGKFESLQKKPNNTGLPDTLKTSAENLSGMSLDDVKVHYNSVKPAQLQAHAYAQGTDIHLAPGQEKHLPHEAWHVVQQKQGRVKPTLQMKGKVNVNDDAGLEKEADEMGDRTLQLASFNTSDINSSAQLKTNGSFHTYAPIQMVKEAEFVADPEDFMSNNVILFEYGKGFSLKFPNTVRAINDRIAENNLIANIKLLMAKKKDSMSFYLQDSGTTAIDDKVVYFTIPALGLLADEEIKSIFKNGDTFLENADELVHILKGEDGGGDNIRANYAPYMIGNPNLQPDGSLDENGWGNVGSTIVDPAVTKFVFTDAMNGCAYGITKVEGEALKYEAWHFQSETDNFTQASHFRATKGIRDWFGVNDYYIGDGTTNLAATNIIWNSDGGTKMLSQKNVIALDGVSKTEFLESTSKDLNVSEDISEEQLDGVHGKLMTGTRKSITQADINRINQDIQALVTEEATANANTSIGRMDSGSDSMKQPEIDEINKISANITSIKAEYAEVDLGIYATQLELMAASLAAISSPGLIYGTNYNKAATKPLKGSFIAYTRDLLAQTLGHIAKAKTVVVTAQEDELNEDLVKTCLKAQFHYDMYKAYEGDYRLLNRALDGLKRVRLKKQAVKTKGDLLAKEKTTLYP